MTQQPRVLVVVVVVVMVVRGVVPLPPPSSLLLDTSLCPASDSLTACQLRKAECGGVQQLVTPAGGAAEVIASCAAAANVSLTPRFFKALGRVEGSQDSLVDLLSPDPEVTTVVRLCVLNATSLLDAETLTVNRSAVAAAVREVVSSQALGDAVAAAVGTCPEPVDFHTEGFMSCLEAACIVNAHKAPLVSQALSVLAPGAKLSPLNTPLPLPLLRP
ncbi:uncharacterized protein [Procambarus clarkii]|uniref:uncharacterized protein n=1 Tax=Procambarus clarkii TaxID=6728 RepID=UPI0037421F84